MGKALQVANIQTAICNLIARLVGVAPINHDSDRYKGKRMIHGGRQLLDF